MYLKNNNNKKKNSKVTARTASAATPLLLTATILVVAGVSSAPLGALASRFGGEEDGGEAEEISIAEAEGGGG